MDHLTEGHSIPTPTPNQTLGDLHAGFLKLLSGIEGVAHVAFRHVRCPQKRDDCIAETVALAWRGYVRAVQMGKDPSEFAATLAHLACRQVRSHRRLCGQEKGKEVMSPLAQSRHSFLTQSLPDCDTGMGGNLGLDALRDNTVTPPPEQAAFRIDFPIWVGSLGEKKRLVAQDLMIGDRTQEVAARRGMTAGRVSQIRVELMLSWRRFHGDA